MRTKFRFNKRTYEYDGERIYYGLATIDNPSTELVTAAKAAYASADVVVIEDFR